MNELYAEIALADAAVLKAEKEEVKVDPKQKKKAAAADAK